MKLLYVTERLPFGPGEAFIIAEIQQLLDRGHDVRILPLRRGGAVVHGEATALLGRTLDVRLLSPGASLALLGTLLRRPQLGVLAFSWLLRSGSPKRLAHNLLAIARGLAAQPLLTEWVPDHIHAHWANYTATMAMTIAAATGIPWSITAHRYDIVFNNLLAEKVRRSRFVRFISQRGQEMAAPLIGPFPHEKAVVLHMGVTLPEPPGEDPSQEEEPDGGPPARPTIALCPANLVPVKGHTHLLQGLALLQRDGISLQLWLAGQGELQEALARQVQEAGLSDRVRFLGQVPHDQLLGFYRTRQVDLVVLPSVDLGGGLHEGIPVSLVEAMAMGVPVVSTTTGSIPELLADGAGILVPPADAGALAQALQELAADPAGRAALGLAGRRQVERAFDVERIAAELEAWFRRGTPQ